MNKEEFEMFVERLKNMRSETNQRAHDRGKSDGMEWAQHVASPSELENLATQDGYRRVAPTPKTLFKKLIEDAPHIVGMDWSSVPDYDGWDYEALDASGWIEWRSGFIQGALGTYKLARPYLE